MFYQHYAPLGLMRYISGKALLYMQHFDTLDQRNARTHISHIALLASLKNLVIGSTFYVHLHGGCTFSSYTMGTSGLPYIYTRSPRATGPRAEGVYIRWNTSVHGIYNYYVTLPCTNHAWASTKQLKPYS